MVGVQQTMDSPTITSLSVSMLVTMMQMRMRMDLAGSMGVAEVRRLRQLEDENRRLKALVADLTLDKHMLQEVIRKKL